jgi:hypothetical protein
MDVRTIFGILVLLIAGGFIAFAIFAWALWAVLAFLPLVVSIPLAAYLWTNGHDHLGAIVGLAGLVAQVYWLLKVDLSP